jgi:hypothetical protein
MLLYRCAHHFGVSARKLVEKSAPFHFCETDFFARRRITLMIATATIAGAGNIATACTDRKRNRRWQSRARLRRRDEAAQDAADKETAAQSASNSSS